MFFFPLLFQSLIYEDGLKQKLGRVICIVKTHYFFTTVDVEVYWCVKWNKILSGKGNRYSERKEVPELTVQVKRLCDRQTHEGHCVHTERLKTHSKYIYLAATKRDISFPARSM